MERSMDMFGRLPEGLTLSISHVQYKKGFPGWNRTAIAPSFHRFYFIAEGRGSVVLNGALYEPKPNQMMIMPAGTNQMALTDQDDPYTRYFCHFDAKVGEWPLFPADSRLYLCDASNPGFIEQTFEELVDLFHRGGPFSLLRAQACLLTMLACCLEDGGYTDIWNDFMGQTERSKLGDVLAYIHKHLHEPMEIERLADIVHLHPNYFIPYFKKIMGVTPMQYVKRKRMDEAKRLLSYTDVPISDIADQIGMQLAYFSRLFKSYTGLSPSAYRTCTR
ncbi:helix-turn-helix transcriptional regulator [Paenibacillus donghaensis]|uniref:helix-turn-helix transcriptional regulator n=1 Tax=Paenibacillus donghaensis TaxID=414771 RepID=UPI001883B799|nr:AraC family transcriptional regulator [Paenibacillus donghaensis]MBE9916520.1 helix-turn-helix transcriptional regulator [Paenibacillus donghaensis]